MAGFRERDKRHFPLRSGQDVVNLFRDQLENNADPDLTLLSIVVGAVESCLTINRSVTPAGNGTNPSVPARFPCLQLATVEALYQRFVVHVRGSVDLTQYEGKHATRELVKKVSDVIWNSLTRSYYKDKAHLQSLYSYLTGNKLDCFGVALAVVAGCQLLGYNDVHLALSEDHAWVVFGADGSQTAEVTWHGKGNEDKRGQPVSAGVSDKSWLYLNGHPVVCTRAMEVAAIVSAVNPAINGAMDSVEVGALQQDLLWLLYDMGHLKRYPMAIGNLGDLEEITPTSGRPSPVELFNKSIEATRRCYRNMHVYPYTYLGGYYFRKGEHRKALKNWSEAAHVISQYNYSREDEEIYKEFLEIANELIPHIVKQAGKELQHYHRCLLLAMASPEGRTAHAKLAAMPVPLLQDPACYSLLLAFYDGICQWEEGSSTPVLHITWAKHLITSLSRFEGKVRINMKVEGDTEEEEEEDDDDEGEDKEDGIKLAEGGDENSNGIFTIGDQKDKAKVEQLKWKLRREVFHGPRPPRRMSMAERKVGLTNNGTTMPREKRGRGRPPKRKPSIVGLASNSHDNALESAKENVDIDKCLDSPKDAAKCAESLDKASPGLTAEFEEEDLDGDPEEEKIKSTIEQLASKVGEESANEVPKSKLAALAQQCGESILNPNYLLGVGEPFTTSMSTSMFNTTTESQVDCSSVNEFLSSQSMTNPFLGISVGSIFKSDETSHPSVSKDPGDDQTQTGSPEDISRHSSDDAKSPSDAVQKPSEPAEPPVRSYDLSLFCPPQRARDQSVASTKSHDHLQEIADENRQPKRNGTKLMAAADLCTKQAPLSLRSAKMRGLKELLVAEKLNASAINLQLTAQSQVHLKHTTVGSNYGYGLQMKRLKRQ